MVRPLDAAYVIPRATYRLQLHGGFGFSAATDCVPYLARLGVSHAYLSPYLKARAGSAHGYDIVDHSQLNPELGDEEAFQRMSQALKAHSLGHILDFVPNHMGVGGADNPLWLDVLEWGPDALHAGWFDVDWDPDRRYLHNRILVPFLGDQYGIELERGVLRLRFDESDGSFAVWAYDTHKLPIWPPHYARILTDGTAQLERLADAFNWLPNWHQQMPQRAAELKTRLAALVRDHADAREAVQRAVQRFEGQPDQSGSWQSLDELIAEQRWRIAHFRVAADDINYRRFFNINDLAGLRMELPEVFDHVHQRVLRWVKDGTLDGLRIDHIDGLYDPKGYLRRLQRRLSTRHAEHGFYLVVEKILAAHEPLREDWPIDGTTGYDFLNQVLALLIDSSAYADFDRCYRQFVGEPQRFADIVHQSKRHIMENEMASELNVLARDMGRLARQNPRTADFTRNLLRRAIKELIACFPVYRTYIDDAGELDSADQRDLSWAFAQARRNESELDPSVFNFLEQVLTGALLQRSRTGFSHQSLLRCAMRLQQYSGPVMAKGVEDTAFYRYHRFIALNEVGGDPERFGATLSSFHKSNQARAHRWPHAMLATATHDTKRGEDARARLAALSEFAEEWIQQLPVWSRILRGPLIAEDAPLKPDRNDEYLLLQLLLGTWPCELMTSEVRDAQLSKDYAQRIRGAMVKSMRESRLHTGWAFPNAEYEEATLGMIDAALTGARSSAFLSSFLPFVRKVADCGVDKSLIQTVVKLTSPGVPDLYNGSELWDLSMVDPDNRRPVDYALRTRLLRQIDERLAADRALGMSELRRNWCDAGIKLATIATLLRHRRDHERLYAEGDYQGLPASGARADDLCAYTRHRNGDKLLVAAVRRAHRADGSKQWEDTVLPVPEALRREQWHELLTGRLVALREDTVGPADLFAELPVVVLASNGH
ncbi:MAG TPA: malto-oligosyltrehalose synthase [Steroidobacteraceae bacterium]|nr:malto-oligosyltrehalose synthase [Steroidobacteraceae bacterium]